MLVKLLLFVIAASSLSVSFSISKHALCCKLFSFNFSPFFFSLFSCTIVDLYKCVMETSFSVVSLFEAFWNYSWSIFSRSFLNSLKIFHLIISKGFELWSFLQRTFHLLLMNDNKSGVIYSHLQWPSRTRTWQRYHYFFNHPRLPWILWCFGKLPTSRSSDDSFPYLTYILFLCLTAIVFTVLREI